MKLDNKKQRWMYFLVVGVNFGFSVAAGLLLGNYIDSWLETKNPYFTLLGLIAGVFSGFTLLYRLLKLKNDKQ